MGPDAVMLDTLAPAPEVLAEAPGLWGLPAADAADVQGLVASPFAHLPDAVALFLQVGRGGAWLRRLMDQGIITAATGQTQPCGAVALTASGLRRIGLPAAVLDTFAAPFLDGMAEPNRQRRLGDDRAIALWRGAWAWSGVDPACPPHPPGLGAATTVHALLLLYADGAGALRALQDDALRLVEPEGVRVAFALPMTLRPGGGEGTPPREHFGFADGFSQPAPHLDAAARDPLHGVPVGEVLMGYPNAHGELAAAPYAPEALDPGGRLLSLPDEAGQASLGLNGTYMTVRQLHQDVAAFRASMAATAAAMGDPSITADTMAERVIGRERDGDVLVPGGALPAVAPGQPDNAFGFFAKDREGMGCPVGSHIRRANPRDGLARDGAAREGALAAVNNHRILRRGRKYGARLPEGAADDWAERGLVFICLHTDIARQFEFIQQTWLLNPVFANLPGETDPLLGPAGPFTLPSEPVRRVAQVETFVTLVGGEYFFLPSFRALRYLGDAG